MKFSIPDMSCGHCKTAIREAVKSMDGAAELEFDMAGRTVTVTSGCTASDIQQALKDAGYQSERLQQI